MQSTFPSVSLLLNKHQSIFFISRTISQIKWESFEKEQLRIIPMRYQKAQYNTFVTYVLIFMINTHKQRTTILTIIFLERTAQLTNC